MSLAMYVKFVDIQVDGGGVDLYESFQFTLIHICRRLTADSAGSVKTICVATPIEHV
jgi:hypothetical protein